MNIMKYKLKNKINLNCFENDYITNLIISNDDFYEHKVLNKWKKYFSDLNLVFDIGSNIGNHTIYFYHEANCKKIYSFEPLKESYECLVKNINDNMINCKAINVAISNKEGYAEVEHSLHNNIGATGLKESTNLTSIKTITLDSFTDSIFEMPDFIKIDVDGSELKVLEGMHNILLKKKPLLWIEVDTNNIDAVISFLLNYDYDILDYDPTKSLNILFEYNLKAPVKKSRLLFDLMQVKELFESEKNDIIENYINDYVSHFTRR